MEESSWQVREPSSRCLPVSGDAKSRGAPASRPVLSGMGGATVTKQRRNISMGMMVQVGGNSALTIPRLTLSQHLL